MTDSYRQEQVCQAYDRGCSFTPLNGKRPILKGWQKAEREPLEQALRWAAQGNVGMRTGEASGISVIDIEADAEISFDSFPPTVTVVTGSGGYHLYYRHHPACRNRAGSLVFPDTDEQIEHVDLRGTGGQVVFVGSIHPETHQPYQWKHGAGPHDVPLTPFPTEFLPKRQAARTIGNRPAPTYIDAYTASALAAILAEVAAAQQGTRNHTLNGSAYRLGRFVAAGYCHEHHVVERLMDAARQCGLSDAEAYKTIQSGLRGGKQRPYGTGEMSNAG